MKESNEIYVNIYSNTKLSVEDLIMNTTYTIITYPTLKMAKENLDPNKSGKTFKLIEVD